MDPHANTHNHIDMDLFHYFDLLVQDDHSTLFRDDKLESHLCDWNQVPQHDQNIYSDQLGLQDIIDPIADFNLWDCWDDHLWLQDFDPYEDFSIWGSYWDDGLSYNDHDSSESSGEVKCTSGDATAGLKVAKRTRSLEFEDIEKHFGMPITMAAKELNVGLTLLKKRCRELNIKRWPHRKLKSLQSLIQNVKEMGLKEEIELLEGHKRMIEKSPEMELTERTKKLRQACFKAKFKKRRVNSTDYPFPFQFP